MYSRQLTMFCHTSGKYPSSRQTKISPKCISSAVNRKYRALLCSHLFVNWRKNDISAALSNIWRLLSRRHAGKTGAHRRFPADSRCQ